MVYNDVIIRAILGLILPPIIKYENTVLLTETISFDRDSFMSHEESVRIIEPACRDNSDIASFSILGESEEGRPIVGVQLGTGNKKVSLVAGAHSDEPVGPETLRSLIVQGLAKRDLLEEFFLEHSLYIVPHVNPDGEQRNKVWMSDWPALGSYLEHVFRELPGRDVEFSYPDRRVENQLVSSWLTGAGPFRLHMSLHGMGFSDGAMLLIEKNWSYRTEQLQVGFTEAAHSVGLQMHDHNRKGEKGFFHIAPGYTTTPEGAAMRTYFLSRDQPDTAELFGDSSMEFVRGLGGDPLSLVTELPLFIVEGDCEPGVPTAYLNFKKALPELRIQANNAAAISEAKATYGLNALPIDQAVYLQLRALELGLSAIGEQNLAE